MNVTPVKKYREPKYPDKQAVLQNPDMLKTLPQRWRGNICVGAAFSTLFLFTLTSCARSVGGEGKTKAEVAPVFDHGSGRGSFGCVSVAPPSFLSEEEAFQVIQEEAESYGISFEKSGKELIKVGLPETRYYLGEGKDIDSTKTGNLQLDGYDSAKRIGFEFVSTIDYESWLAKEGMYSTVNTYDFLTTAQMLKKGIEGKNGETTMGVFYNPMIQLSREEIEEVRKGDDWSALQNKLISMAKENLKEQVKDFLMWLKAQGIM